MAKKGENIHILRNDPETIERLCKEYIGYAIAVAKRIMAKGKSTRTDDATAEALLILVKCARSYDESRGVPFKGFLAKSLAYHLPRWMALRLKFQVGLPASQTETEGKLFEVTDEREERIDAINDARHNAQKIRRVLSQREYDILLKRQTMTLIEVAKEYGLTKTRIQQIEARAYETVKRRLAA